MKYGTCLSRYLPRSRIGGNELERFGYFQRLFVVVTSGASGV